MTRDWIAGLDRAGLSVVLRRKRDGRTFGVKGDARTAVRDGVGVVFSGVLYESPQENPAQAVLEAYGDQGESFAASLRGIYSFCLWDSRKDVLLAVRDPMGVHPLFHTGRAGRFLASNSLEALLKHPGVSAEVSRGAVAAELAQVWSTPAETIYRDVARVPPGHLYRLNGSSSASRRYWDPSPPGEGIRWVKGDELGRFDELMARAVRRCMALGPAAIFLSGGLDSIGVATSASRLLANGHKPLALSVVFPHPSCYEKPTQVAIARRLGMEQVLLPFFEGAGPGGFLQTAVEQARDVPEPPINLWMPVFRTLGRLGIERGFRNVLTGGGGDEWLGVTPSLAADHLRFLDVGGVFQIWNSHRRSFPSTSLHSLRLVSWGFGLRPLLRAAVVRSLEAMAPDMTGRLLRHRKRGRVPRWVAPDPEVRADLHRRLDLERERQRGMTFYEYEMRTALGHVLASREMEEFFDFGRDPGFRLLQPLQDVDLIDFLYRTPPHMLIRGGRSKGLLRMKLAREHPGLNLRWVRKMVANEFHNSILKTEGPAVLEAVGGPRNLVRAGIVEEQATGRYIDSLWTETLPKHVWNVWGILRLERWLEGRL